jgi:hypothetical protein
VVVDGDVQGLPSGMFVLTAAAAVATPDDLLEAGHTLDIEMEKIAGKGMFITHDRRQRMQIAPAAETSAAQNTADGGGTESGASRNLIGRTLLTAEFDDQLHPARRSGSGTAMRTRGAVAQSGSSFLSITANPLGRGFGSDLKTGSGTAET